jgi:molybdopterin synthase sulfur carrier subunit
MKVTILYFGQLKEQVGTAKEVIDSKANTVSEIYQQLKESHGLSLSFANLRAARNEIFCEGTDPVREDDVIAFMPPMSGG